VIPTKFAISNNRLSTGDGAFVVIFGKFGCPSNGALPFGRWNTSLIANVGRDGLVIVIPCYMFFSHC